MHRFQAWAVGIGCVVGSSLAAGQTAPPADLASLLTRVGERVERYYARAQSIVCRETVRVQPLGLDFLPDGHARRIVSELRIDWDPPQDGAAAAEANVLRQVLTVDGRTPRPGDEPGCMDPKPVSPEPLAMLLGIHRADYAFSSLRSAKRDGRAAFTIDFKSLESGPPAVAFRDNCVSFSVPGRSKGRVWVDAATNDVLRLDEELTGSIDFLIPREHRIPGGPSSMVLDRYHSSIRYRAVTFQDPEETLMLPAAIDTLTVIQGTGMPRVRTTQEFSDYKRFLTDARIVKDPATR